MMQKMKIGIITYDIPHLKTEQLLCNLICMGGGGNLIIYALPFIEREERVVLFPHRPYSKKSVSAESIAIRHRIPYRRCLSDMEIDGECDVYLVAGTNILSKNILAFFLSFTDPFPDISCIVKQRHKPGSGALQQRTLSYTGHTFSELLQAFLQLRRLQNGSCPARDTVF